MPSLQRKYGNIVMDTKNARSLEWEAQNCDNDGCWWRRRVWLQRLGSQLLEVGQFDGNSDGLGCGQWSGDDCWDDATVMARSARRWAYGTQLRQWRLLGLLGCADSAPAKTWSSWKVDSSVTVTDGCNDLVVTAMSWSAGRQIVCGQWLGRHERLLRRQYLDRLEGIGRLLWRHLLLSPLGSGLGDRKGLS